MEEAPVPAAIDVEGVTKSEDSLFNDEEDRAETTKSLIRFFAIIRLIITIIATGFIFIHYPSVIEGPKPIESREELKWRNDNLAEFEQKKYRDESSYHLYIEKLLKYQKIEYDKQQNDQFWRSREIFRFQYKFGINSINILITALIWAGAFANKKNCIPIYAILEVIFSSCFFVWWSHSLMSTPEMMSMAVPLSLLILFVFCGFFIPLVLKRHYEYIDKEDRDMKRVMFGEKKKEKKEQGPETQTLLGEEKNNENELAE